MSPSLNILMEEIGKILGENWEKIGKTFEKTGKLDFEHPIKQWPRYASENGFTFWQSKKNPSFSFCVYSKASERQFYKISVLRIWSPGKSMCSYGILALLEILMCSSIHFTYPGKFKRVLVPFLVLL